MQSNPSRPFTGKGGHAAQNNHIYGTPLPILLHTSSLHPSSTNNFKSGRHPIPSTSQSITNSIKYLLPSILHSAEKGRENITPLCTGIYDRHTRSVWVADEADRRILFERDFFGKGNLSRSTPSWGARQVKRLNEERTGSGMTAEEVTASRRLERKQFKLDRAQAILNASLQAEAILARQSTSSPLSEIPPPPSPSTSTSLLNDNSAPNSLTNKQTKASLNVQTSLNTAIIPEFNEYAHVLPENEVRLTPQTFLVRPTRPAQGGPRSRGKPKPRVAFVPGAGGTAEGSQTIVTERPGRGEMEGVDKEQVVKIEVDDLEHLQLSVEEAVFLCWGLGCLRVMDPETNAEIQPSQILSFLLAPSFPQPIGSTSTSIPTDHPVLLSYIAYHHYRSLGWVVKTGIKFCADWLLYKRGMVFSHAEYVTWLSSYPVLYHSVLGRRLIVLILT